MYKRGHKDQCCTGPHTPGPPWLTDTPVDVSAVTVADHVANKRLVHGSPARGGKADQAGDSGVICWTWCYCCTCVASSRTSAVLPHERFVCACQGSRSRTLDTQSVARSGLYTIRHRAPTLTQQPNRLAGAGSDATRLKWCQQVAEKPLAQLLAAANEVVVGQASTSTGDPVRHCTRGWHAISSLHVSNGLHACACKRIDGEVLPAVSSVLEGERGQEGARTRWTPSAATFWTASRRTMC